MKIFVAIVSLMPFIGTVILFAESGVGIMASGDKLTRPGKMVLQRIAIISASLDGAGIFTFGLAWIPGAIFRLIVRTLIYAPIFAKVAFKPDPKKTAAVAQANEQMAMAVVMQNQQAANIANQSFQAEVARKQMETEAYITSAKERADDEQEEVTEVSYKKGRTENKTPVKQAGSVVAAPKNTQPQKVNPKSITSNKRTGASQIGPYARSTRPSPARPGAPHTASSDQLKRQSSFYTDEVVDVPDKKGFERANQKDDEKISRAIKDIISRRVN